MSRIEQFSAYPTGAPAVEPFFDGVMINRPGPDDRFTAAEARSVLTGLLAWSNAQPGGEYVTVPRPLLIKAVEAAWCCGGTGIDPRERVHKLLAGEPVEDVDADRMPWPWTEEYRRVSALRRDQVAVEMAQLLGLVSP